VAKSVHEGEMFLRRVVDGFSWHKIVSFPLIFTLCDSFMFPRRRDGVRTVITASFYDQKLITSLGEQCKSKACTDAVMTMLMYRLIYINPLKPSG
jgi:hypothetical protein